MKRRGEALGDSQGLAQPVCDFYFVEQMCPKALFEI